MPDLRGPLTAALVARLTLTPPQARIRRFEATRARASQVPVIKNTVDQGCFNQGGVLPYNLRLHDFHLAMQDVYDLRHVDSESCEALPLINRE